MSDSLMLWCLIDGDPIPFEVLISTNANVSRLKELIREKGIDSSMVTTLAKDLALWKLKEPVLVKPSKTLAKRAQLQETTELEEASDKVSVIFPVPPPEDHLHIIVKLLHAASAKRKRELSDITQMLFARWVQRIGILPPTVTELVAYLNKPLQEIDKIPIPSHEMRMLVMLRGDPKHSCSQVDLEQLFRCSEDEEADLIWTILKGAITTNAPDYDGTELSFVSFWDDNIRKILASVISPSKIIRNSNHLMSTLLKRPDFGLLMNGVCTFRGEEKSPTFTGSHPKDELIDKLSWTYDPAPYILGYYAVGATVTLVAMSSSQVVDLVTTDLSYKTQRVKHLLYMIKMCTLLPLLRTILGSREGSEFDRMTRESGTVIEVGSSIIKKTYHGHNRSNHVLYLRNIYHLLVQKAVPNVDRLIQFYAGDREHGSVIYLQPKGIAVQPRSAEEVLQAVTCVLAALVVLHAEPNCLFHRDIRWPNVIRSAANESRWFLIDWDDAAMAPTRAAPHLHPSEHSPRVFSDNHGSEVDLWGVGKLIIVARSFVPGIPAEMMKIGENLVAGTVETAIQALRYVQAGSFGIPSL